MKKNQIVVRISGAAGTGKSTIAIAVSDFLVALGFDILLVDDDDESIGKKRIYQNKRLSRVRDSTNVRVVTVHTRRRFR